MDPPVSRCCEKTLSWLPLALIALVTASVLPAVAEPLSLELNEKGDIVIVGSNPEPLEIRIDIVDTSKGTWRSIRPTGTFELDAGPQITRSASYKLLDGSTVNHTTNASIDGRAVLIKALCETKSTSPGFIRVDFWASEYVASDLTITIDGKERVRNKEFRKGGHPMPKEIVGTITSTGAVLYKITGEMNTASPELPLGPRGEGFILRLASGSARDGLISDLKEQNLRIEFPEE